MYRCSDTCVVTVRHSTSTRSTHTAHPPETGPPHPEIARRSQARGGAARGSSGARWQRRRLRRRRRRRRHGALRARRRVQLLNCGRANDGMRRCGARACGLLAGRAQRVVTRGCAVDARIRQQAAGSSGERTCSGEHVEREQQQLAFLLFSCGRTRCRSAPASARSAPARRRRERRLEARSTHRRPLLAPASGRGKRVMVQWIGRRREQGASCGCTPASCSPRVVSSGEGGAQDSLCRFVRF